MINSNSILISRRSKEERSKFHRALIYKKIKKYIKNGCVGDLDLKWTPIEYLPDELKYVGGTLNLNYSQIKKLPDGLKIKKDLWLYEYRLEEYSNNVEFNGELDLQYSNIKKLPDNLTVNGSLFINFTDILKIPKNLNIKRHLYCYSTPLLVYNTRKEIKQMIINNGGSVDKVNP